MFEKSLLFQNPIYKQTCLLSSSVVDLDALGEYTGVKPDEFLTLDKHTMETTGQIMYDTPTGTMAKGNSCSTIDRLDRRRGEPAVRLINNHHGPIDYETGKFVREVWSKNSEFKHRIHTLENNSLH